ncbi:hypothetical protein RI129_002278 [Pyrocoelia pectoralis]|uniref:Uncharacterized protein n=1 Tax=Pyrocoelia pectoralis TaxID=417401 RepID=A0AAN7VLK2_9COLE
MWIIFYIFVVITELIEYQKECAAEAGIKGETIKKVIKDLAAGQFPSLDQLKRFPLCMMTKVGFMDENGNLNPDPLKKYLDAIRKEPQTVMGCKDRKGEDILSTACEICLCVYQEGFKKRMN